MPVGQSCIVAPKSDHATTPFAELCEGGILRFEWRCCLRDAPFTASGSGEFLQTVRQETGVEYECGSCYDRKCSVLS